MWYACDTLQYTWQCGIDLKHIIYLWFLVIFDLASFIVIYLANCSSCVSFCIKLLLLFSSYLVFLKIWQNAYSFHLLLFLYPVIWLILLIDKLGNACLTSFFVTGAWDHSKLRQSSKAYQNAVSLQRKNFP